MTRLSARPYAIRDAEYLAQQGLHPVLARLMAARGLHDPHDLSTELDALIKPDVLTHVDRAAVFLADAIDAGRRMVIVADYDCDGATACAVGIRGLRALGAHVDYIVPNRFEYGYGLTPEIVALAVKEKTPDIIITVDNGIASIEGVDEANRRGIPVVVTDHHLPGATLPAAEVIVNPNQPACGFPSKNLAGVGVMFYTLLALRAELRRRDRFDSASQPRLDHLLDLVALGTVADVVKLDSNNRILVAQGLRRIRSGRAHPGIAALFSVAGRDTRKANPFDLGFTAGPRLNAAGRLADMSLGIECLLSDDNHRAWEIARQLDDINRERREIEAGIQEAALASLEHIEPTDKAALTLFDPSWHQGVIGIVASRLKEKFFRPTITFAPAGSGMIRGSGRSIPGFHLRDAIDLVYKRHPQLIDKFGGHAMAAGLSLREDNFPSFAEAFEQVAREWLSAADLEHVLEHDGSLPLAYYTLDFIDQLDAQVWGQGFAPPLFCDEFQVLSQRVLKDKHLKLQLQRDNRKFDAIWFNHADSLPDRIRAAYRLDANEYNGRTTVQLMVAFAESSDEAVSRSTV
ncbi:MAG: single-stranded-DNA-specific exonuclease RecJ [Oxalobacteraceae bacterium]|nr:single-stranded-DNA-specific exonuclease RecJ [Oxalobacteraceae bacterium]